MESKLVTAQIIEKKIFTFRGYQEMVDKDLSELYQVEVKRLNEQVKRNVERFPSHFRFQLSDSEKNELVANCDRFTLLKHSSSNPLLLVFFLGGSACSGLSGQVVILPLALDYPLT